MEKVPLENLHTLARETLKKLSLATARDERATIVALSGDLGAGKTTFVQALAKELGVDTTVQSPTYVLMKSYSLPEGLNPWGAKRRFKRLIHIDAYRLENPSELVEAARQVGRGERSLKEFSAALARGGR